MTDVTDVRTWDARRVGSIVVVVLVAVALGLGAAFVGSPDRASVDDPAAYVRSFYEQSDVAGLLAALAPGSLTEEQRVQAEQDLANLLQPGVEVVGTQEHQLLGTTFTEVRTSDGLIWCVDPGGTLYVRCRVASAPVSVEAGELPLGTSLAQVDVFPGHVELVLGLTTTGDATVTFGPDVELTSGAGDLQLVQSAAASGGQITPVQLANFELTPPLTLFLVWRGDLASVADQTLSLDWDGGSVDVVVGEVEPLA